MRVMSPGPKTLGRLLPAIRIELLITVPHHHTFGKLFQFLPLSFQPIPPCKVVSRFPEELPRAREVGVKPGETIVGQRFQRPPEFLVGSRDGFPVGDGDGSLVDIRSEAAYVRSNEPDGQTGGVNLVLEPVDGCQPVLHRRLPCSRPALGEIRGEDQLEETKVGEAVRRDDLAQKLGGAEALAWVVIPRGRPSVVGSPSAEKWDFPTWVGLVIVDDETVAREEGELGILAQVTADQE